MPSLTGLVVAAKKVVAAGAGVWRYCNGDAAYQRYLQHWHAQHRGEQAAPLDRKAFFAAEMQRKWSGVKRCC